MTNELVKRLKDLGQGGFDLDFDALDKVTSEARKQCSGAESLACEAADEIERLQEVLTFPIITLEASSSALFIRVLSEHEKGQPVNGQDLINALMWRVRNQRREIGRLQAKRGRSASSPQAPIAKVTIRESGAGHYAPDEVSVSLYAPGLPPGEHDLYCEPKAIAPYANSTEDMVKVLRDPNCTFNSGYRFVAANEIEQLHGNLSLAEEGLANYALEVERKNTLIDAQHAAQTSLHAENVRLRALMDHVDDLASHNTTGCGTCSTIVSTINRSPEPGAAHHPSLIPALRRAQDVGDQLAGAAADALETPGVVYDKIGVLRPDGEFTTYEGCDGDPVYIRRMLKSGVCPWCGNLHVGTDCKAEKANAETNV